MINTSRLWALISWWMEYIYIRCNNIHTFRNWLISGHSFRMSHSYTWDELSRRVSELIRRSSITQDVIVWPLIAHEPIIPQDPTCKQTSVKAIVYKKTCPFENEPSAAYSRDQLNDVHFKIVLWSGSWIYIGNRTYGTINVGIKWPNADNGVNVYRNTNGEDKE